MQLIAEARIRVKDLVRDKQMAEVPITFGAREGQRLAVGLPLFPLRWEGAKLGDLIS